MIFGVTGHRGVEQQPGELDRFARLSVARMVSKGASRVISGLALGWDTAVAKACCDLDIPYVAAVPHRKQADFWSNAQKLEWVRLIDNADEVNFANNGVIPSNSDYHNRNHFIVDRSVELWSLYDGRIHGGTRHCILYGEEQGRRIVPLWQDWLEFRRTHNA